ncbi:MAG: aldose 1-epimerase family protein, partial [Planctomycetaceae bacterium]|nr:aldose 1-epimerase family protein [Planctomycetaceae bacterium]
MKFELINTRQGIHDTQSRITSASHSVLQQSGEGWSVSMHRMHGGLSDGVDVITLNNGRMTLWILPTRGMGIWRGEVDGIPLQWNSPVEMPVHPSFVDQSRRGGIGWLDGFNELICRCGLGWHGAPGTDILRNPDGSVVSEQFLPLHGRIANLAAHQVTVEISEDDRGLITVTGVVDETSVFGGRLRLTSVLSTVTGSNSFEIADTVTNLGSTQAEVEMLYHCNVGEPFLAAGSVYHGAASEVAPRDARAAEGLSMWNIYEGPSRGFAEQVYFCAAAADVNGWGIGVLTDEDAQHAFCVRYDTATLPYFALWKNTQALEDGYCTGLEPASSFPNLRSVERENGRVIQLAPHHSVTFRLSFEAAADRKRV